MSWLDTPHALAHHGLPPGRLRRDATLEARPCWRARPRIFDDAATADFAALADARRVAHRRSPVSSDPSAVVVRCALGVRRHRGGGETSRGASPTSPRGQGAPESLKLVECARPSRPLQPTTLRVRARCSYDDAGRFRAPAPPDWNTTQHQSPLLGKRPKGVQANRRLRRQSDHHTFAARGVVTRRHARQPHDRHRPRGLFQVRRGARRSRRRTSRRSRATTAARCRRRGGKRAAARGGARAGATLTARSRACAVLGVKQPAVEALLPAHAPLLFSHDQGPAREHGLARRVPRAARSADRLRVHPRRRRDGGRRRVAFGRYAGRAGAIGALRSVLGPGERLLVADGATTPLLHAGSAYMHADYADALAAARARARASRPAACPRGRGAARRRRRGARGNRARALDVLDALGADDAAALARVAPSELPALVARADDAARRRVHVCAVPLEQLARRSRCGRRRAATAPSTSSTPSGTSPLSTRRSRRTRRS